MFKRAGLAVALFSAVVGYSSIAVAGSMATGSLPDGRLTLFVVQDGKLLTAWKKTKNPNSDWTALGVFTPAPSGTVNDVTVGRLPDGRLQLFLSGSDGLTTSWKKTTDPNSLWTDWTPFQN